jgi:3-oxoadipate CoA-transferase beta subunit
MKKLDRKQIAARVARDIPEGAYVNLGIGLPTLVGDYLPKGREIILHSENGILGVGPKPPEDELDEDLINASKEPITLLAGGAYFHQADSFGMIRGRHLDLAILGRSRSRPAAISPTGTPAAPTRFPRSAARWTSRSARRRCS